MIGANNHATYLIRLRFVMGWIVVRTEASRVRGSLARYEVTIVIRCYIDQNRVSRHALVLRATLEKTVLTSPVLYERKAACLT